MTKVAVGDLFRSPTAGDLNLFIFLQNECEPFDIVKNF